MQALGHVGLVTVLVGDDPASEIYIRLKHQAALDAGIDATDLRLPADISEAELLARIAALNADDAVDAMLVQLPLPAAHRRGEGDPRRRARRRTSTASIR